MQLHCDPEPRVKEGLTHPVRRGYDPVLRGKAAAEQRDGRARREEGAEAHYAVAHHAAAAVALD